MILKKIKLYLQLVRMDKPIGSLLLVWPTLWALWFAFDGKPDDFFARHRDYAVCRLHNQ